MKRKRIIVARTGTPWAASPLLIAAAVALSISQSFAAQPSGDARAFLPPDQGERGCWASVFDGTAFRGDAARLTGRSFIERFDSDPQVLEPDLRNVGGQDFFQRIDSLIVGPHAKLIAYAGQWFDAAEITFLPNARVSDLRKLNFANRIESVKLVCVH